MVVKQIVLEDSLTKSWHWGWEERVAVEVQASDTGVGGCRMEEMSRNEGPHAKVPFSLQQGPSAEGTTGEGHAHLLKDV